MRPTRFLVLAATLGGVAFLPSPALAHDLKAVVKVGAEKVTVEAGFDDDTPAELARVKVTAADGQELTAGKTDEKGVFEFPRPAPGDYAVVVEIAGHRDRVSFTIPKPTATDSPSSEPTEHSGWRLNKRFGAAAGLGVLLGGTALFVIVRRKPDVPTQP